MHNEKAIEKIQRKLSRLGVDSFLVNDEKNIQYLTGFYVPGVLLCILKRGRSGYFIDSMNRTLAEKFLDTRQINIYEGAGPAFQVFSKYAKDFNIRRILFDPEKISVLIYNKLSKLLPKVKLMSMIDKMPAASIFKEIRKVKVPEEIAILRKAAKNTVRIWRNITKNVKVGITEKELALMIDMSVRRYGCNNSFSTIAAIGINSAYPHAIPTGKRLKQGEHVLVDFGMCYQGYCSDLTRVYCKGRINRQIKEFYNSVQKAHDYAIKKIKPGVIINSVAKAANTILKNDGYGDFILHGLGHGVGLDIHEEPFLREGNRKRFVEGMVVTVEPGLYKKGLGGIRLEDIVLVTKNGCEVLTK